MRIFVTGATGVVGIRAVPQLVAAGHPVTAVGRNLEMRAQLLRAGASAISVDLFDPDQVRSALTGHDVIVNLATHIPPTSRIFLPGAWRENDRIRREASKVLVDAALQQGVQRFIQESFAPIYEDAGDRWIDESSPVRPVRYNRSILDAEAAVQRFVQQGGAGVVLRFAGFYGPDAEQVHDMVRFIRRGWAPMPGRPEGFLSWVSHDDAATAVVAALRAALGTYNVVDDEPLRRGEFFTSLAEMLRARPPRFLPPWTSRLFGSLGELLARSLRISNRKLREEAGWKPTYPSARDGWRAVLSESPKAA
jgi:nucleoside-diphosphate-sugar epimerase